MNKNECAVILFSNFRNKFNINCNTKNRLDKAFELFIKNRIEKFICVGGYREDKEFTGSKLMAHYLITNFNLPDSVIFYDSTSFDTITNIESALQICKNEGIESITFVSDDYHLMRVDYLMKELNLENIKYGFYASNKLSEMNLLDKFVIINKEAFVYLLYNILSTETYLGLLESVR